jgi:hypothetical protein
MSVEAMENASMQVREYTGEFRIDAAGSMCEHGGSVNEV